MTDDPRARLRAERKAQLVAASDAVRRDLGARLPSDRGYADSTVARLFSAANALVRRQPMAVAALAFALAFVGTRRIFGALRWAAVALPLHPLGRRLMVTVGGRLIETLTARASPGARGRRTV